MKPVLELNQLCVSLQGRKKTKDLVKGISFSVAPGECLGILGESGSGKSTMGRVICGLLKPDTGEVMIDGTSVYASRKGRKELQNKLRNKILED